MPKKVKVRRVKVRYDNTYLAHLKLARARGQRKQWVLGVGLKIVGSDEKGT